MSVSGRSVDAIRASYEELRRGADFPAAQLTRPDVPLALPAPEASQQLPQSSTAATPAGSAPEQSDIDQAWRQLTNLRERWVLASSPCTCLSSQASMSISQAGCPRLHAKAAHGSRLGTRSHSSSAISQAILNSYLHHAWCVICSCRIL